MTPDVAAAVEEIRDAFRDSEVTVRDDSTGGALVTVDPVDPGPPYVQDETWIGFQITFQYPVSDVYPLFVRPDLARRDGQGLGEGMQITQWEGRQAVQLSRRSNRLNPSTNTALFKLWKVLDWMATR